MKAGAADNQNVTLVRDNLANTAVYNENQVYENYPPFMEGSASVDDTFPLDALLTYDLGNYILNNASKLSQIYIDSQMHNVNAPAASGAFDTVLHPRKLAEYCEHCVPEHESV